MMETAVSPETPHPFLSSPHRTILALSVPVLLSLIAEPLTGLIDTAFIADLGAVSLAALGVGTAALSSVFWIFNFLGIGTQTEVAKASGSNQSEQASRTTGLALLLSMGFGIGIIVLGMVLAPAAARALGAEGAVLANAVVYMRVRLFGAPAVLVVLTAFGAMRGLQDMRTPMLIALVVNAINIGLDALLIPGWGPFPELGVAGAALASALAQWVGAAWALTAVIRRLGWPQQLKWQEAGRLLQVGGDLFVRTGMLTLFLLITTRVATQASAEAGAAHQAIRQFWTFAALGLDALAITAQSLVGYFMGLKRVDAAKQVAWVGVVWSVALGVLISVVMWGGRAWFIDLFVPDTAVSVFIPAWWAALLMQPVNALAFLTDGIHWGTGDFRFLRNGMTAVSLFSAALLLLINTQSPHALTWVWVVTAVWIALRAVLGVTRVWPGIGRSPFKELSPAGYADS
ncbi:MAG: MATE family efflux transporter [Candidatus Thermofonsia bacterium]|nr:MAG: MATE family efflux transporter [Candidatus Thermofonsia bacterium]